MEETAHARGKQVFLGLKKWKHWPQLGCLIFSTFLLLLVFRKINNREFWETLRQAKAGWLITAFFAYGVALWAASQRWHVALRLTHRATHPSASYRVFLLGHFFFVVLLGGLAGDLAKAAVYARWFNFALPEVIASVPLDRCMGMTATFCLALGTATAAIIVHRNGFSFFQRLHQEMDSSRFGVGVLAGLATLIVLILLALVFWRPRGESAFGRIARTFRAGAMQLFRRPKMAAKGMLFALLAQTAWSSVLALSLTAVTPEPLSWGRLAWAFPVITAISTVPLTFAGAGVRELATVTLLAPYGVPASACVAAALLTLLQKMLWAGIGGTVLWREESRFGRLSGQTRPKTISVVIEPSGTPEALPQTAESARAVAEVRDITVLSGNNSDRGSAAGADAGPSPANWAGDVVLFMSAGELLPAYAGRAILDCLRDQTVVAGTLRDGPAGEFTWLLSSQCGFVAQMMQRLGLGGGPFFVRKQLFESLDPAEIHQTRLGLSRRVCKTGRVALADARITRPMALPHKPALTVPAYRDQP